MEPRATILVVGDTADIADLLRDVLGEAGYRVLVAPTVDIGLKILAAFVVRLVLIHAPTPADGDADAGDCWAALDRLAYAARRTPLIVYAGDNPARYADHAAHGYAAHLATPLDLDVLVRTIAGFLPPARTAPTIVRGTAAALQG